MDSDTFPLSYLHRDAAEARAGAREVVPPDKTVSVYAAEIRRRDEAILRSLAESQGFAMEVVTGSGDRFVRAVQGALQTGWTLGELKQAFISHGMGLLVGEQVDHSFYTHDRKGCRSLDLTAIQAWADTMQSDAADIDDFVILGATNYLNIVVHVLSPRVGSKALRFAPSGDRPSSEIWLGRLQEVIEPRTGIVHLRRGYAVLRPTIARPSQPASVSRATNDGPSRSSTTRRLYVPPFDVPDSFFRRSSLVTGYVEVPHIVLPGATELQVELQIDFDQLEPSPCTRTRTALSSADHILNGQHRSSGDTRTAHVPHYEGQQVSPQSPLDKHTDGLTKSAPVDASSEPSTSDQLILVRGFPSGDFHIDEVDVHQGRVMIVHTVMVQLGTRVTLQPWKGSRKALPYRTPPVLPGLTSPTKAAKPLDEDKTTRSVATGDKPSWLVTYDQLEGQTRRAPEQRDANEERLAARRQEGQEYLARWRATAEMSDDLKELSSLYYRSAAALSDAKKASHFDPKRVSYEARRFEEIRRRRADLGDSFGLMTARTHWVDHSHLFVPGDG